MTYEPHPWSEQKQEIADQLRAAGNENDARYIEEDIGELDTMYARSQDGTNDHNLLRRWYKGLIRLLEGTKPIYEITAAMETNLQNFKLSAPHDPPQTRQYQWKYETARKANRGGG